MSYGSEKHNPAGYQGQELQGHPSCGLCACSCHGEAVAATMACWWARLAIRKPWQLPGSYRQIYHLTFCEIWPRCIGELGYWQVMPTGVNKLEVSKLVPASISILKEKPNWFLPLRHFRISKQIPFCLWSLYFSTYCFCTGFQVKWVCACGP